MSFIKRGKGNIIGTVELCFDKKANEYGFKYTEEKKKKKREKGKVSYLNQNKG